MIEENAPVHCPGTDLDLPFEEDAQDGLSNIPKRRTESWCIIESRDSCGFISTWHEHVVSHRCLSFCVVSSCVSHCHSTGRSSTAIADTCGAGISWGFHGSLRLHSTSEPVFGVTSQSTQKWGILSRNAFLKIVLLPLEKDVLIFIVFMFWEHRWRNPDKAASHPEVAQWHSGSMKLRAWKTLKSDPRKKHGTTKEQMCRIKINLASNAYFVDALSYAYFAFRCIYHV